MLNPLVTGSSHLSYLGHVRNMPNGNSGFEYSIF